MKRQCCIVISSLLIAAAVFADVAADHRTAAESGDAQAQCLLGECYLEGKGVAQDVAEAVRLFRLGAAGGNARAAFRLGVCYDTGCGLTEDSEKAMKWLLKAQHLGNDEASRYLAEKRRRTVKTPRCEAVGQGEVK